MNRKKNTIPTDLIAPCGMNCRLCWGYLREKNTCPGCLRIDQRECQKSKHRTSCIIRDCEHFKAGGNRYCSDKCEKYPCYRLKQLDKRYRTKYGMSMIDNLNMISEHGIRHFIQKEKEKWACPGCNELLSVHKPACTNCGHQWN